MFFEKHGPLIMLVSGDMFNVSRSCYVTIDLLGFSASGKCGILPDFAYELLLGCAVLWASPYVLDYAKLNLNNPLTKMPPNPLFLFPDVILEKLPAHCESSKIMQHDRFDENSRAPRKANALVARTRISDSQYSSIGENETDMNNYHSKARYWSAVSQLGLIRQGPAHRVWIDWCRILIDFTCFSGIPDDSGISDQNNIHTIV